MAKGRDLPISFNTVESMSRKSISQSLCRAPSAASCCFTSNLIPCLSSQKIFFNVKWYHGELFKWIPFLSSFQPNQSPHFLSMHLSLTCIESRNGEKCSSSSHSGFYSRKHSTALHGALILKWGFSETAINIC